VVPQAKASAGAAVNNTVRQVGGALGVAVIGTVLASTYGGHLGRAVAPLPPPLRAAAKQSIGATVQIVQHAPRALRPQARRLLARADTAYADAMHDAAWVSAGGALIGAVATALWLPGRGRRGADPYPVTGSSAPGGSARARRREGRPARARRS
jgi:hypothetical protein